MEKKNAVVGVVATSSDKVLVTSRLEGTTLDEMDSSEILKSSSKD